MTLAPIPKRAASPRREARWGSSSPTTCRAGKCASELSSRFLWGDGSPTREFLYVLDAARAFRLALESYDAADPVNLGSGEEISIRDLAERVRQAVGFTGTIEWDASRPNGQPRRKLETSRAQERFGFRAETTLDQGLIATIEWYRTHKAIADAS
jgi:GDP-L-fucose synthase